MVTESKCGYSKKLLLHYSPSHHKIERRLTNVDVQNCWRSLYHRLEHRLDLIDLDVYQVCFTHSPAYD